MFTVVNSEQELPLSEHPPPSEAASDTQPERRMWEPESGETPLPVQHGWRTSVTKGLFQHFSNFTRMQPASRSRCCPLKCCAGVLLGK